MVILLVLLAVLAVNFGIDLTFAGEGDDNVEPCTTCGDSADDAPARHGGGLSTSTSCLTGSALSSAGTKTFRTDTAPELDWYQPCDGGDNLVDFYINVYDIDVSAIESAKLTLAVWDVDYYCGSACGGVCERDEVYLNGHRLITPVEHLTGANQQWSTVTFNVDPAWIVDGNNLVEIRIDVLSGLCWCVECDWGELTVTSETIDLAIEAEDISISPKSWWQFWKQPFIIRVDVSNEGVLDANNVEVRIVRMSRNNIELQSVTKTIGQIPGGERVTVSTDWNLDFDDKIQVIADPANSIAEAKEDNNIAHTTETSGRVMSNSGAPLTNVCVTYQEWTGSEWDDTDISLFTDNLGAYFINNSFSAITNNREGRVRSNLEFSPTRDLSDIKFRVYDESEWGNGRSRASGAETYSALTSSWTMDKTKSYTRDIQYADHNCVLAYNTLVNAYYYWNTLTPSLAPDMTVDVEVNDDDYTNQTSYMSGNAIHIWHTHSPHASIVAHEYAHVVSDDWGTPYNPIDENFANYGSCRARNTNLFQFPTATIDLSNLEDTDGDNELAGNITVRNPVWSFQLAGIYWELLTDEVYEALQEGPSTAREFYDDYDGTPDAAIKQIFRRHLVPTTGWPPAGPGDPDIFTDTYADYKVDTNSDGFAEYLNIDIGFDIPVAGVYYIYAFLTDAVGDDYCSAAEVQSLDAGAQIVTISFDGNEIFTDRLSGNYILSDAYIADENMDEIDWRINAYTTATSYDYTEFQSPDIYMTGNYSDLGIDIDTDGAFDYLAVDVEINVSTPGGYLAMANLYSAAGDFIDRAETYADLDSGTQSIRFAFDGLTLQAHQIDGPYVMRGVFISDGYYMPVYANDSSSCETSAYSYTEFQEPGATLSIPTLDHGTDQDADGLYDYLTVETTVDVNSSGDYHLEARLYSSLGAFITAQSLDEYLDTGVLSLPVNLDGIVIREHGWDGPFDVTLYLYNTDGVLISIVTHATSAYSYTQFQLAPEDSFDMTFADYGKDTDANGLYDYLTLDVDISSQSRSGSFSLDAYLCDADGNLVSFAPTGVGVDAVPNRAVLDFSGLQMWRAKILDGIYDLRLKIYDSEDVLVAEWMNIYSTSAYSYTQFEAPVAAFDDMYADQGVDINGDGLYEDLAIAVGVEAEIEGDYMLSGILAGSEIDRAVSLIHLDMGGNLVILTFEGDAIYEHHQDGPYALAELALYDSNGMLEDSRDVAYTTFPYSYTQFRDPVVLTGSYSDYGLDTDSDGLYDYLTVEVEVIVANAGNYALNARLMDKNGKEIVWAAASSSLPADVPQLIQLDFDGLSINKHGADGPYYLRDVYVYNIADVGQSDYVYDAYTTSYYDYTDFETILNTDLPNVKLIHADPTVNEINVSGLDLSEIDETYKPEGVSSRSAYMVDAAGSGSFTLEFTDIVDASAIRVYKVDPDSTPPHQWIELDYTTTASTVTFTMSVGDPPVVFAAIAQIVGETRAINCDILPGVNVTLYQGAAEITSTLSGGSGNYTFPNLEFGDYNVTASKDGFKDRTQAISVNETTIYTLDFLGNHGLIPNAPNMSYVLACINRWKFGEPPCKLNMSTVLAVINAWKFPI
jgi:hypothetical protein